MTKCSRAWRRDRWTAAALVLYASAVATSLVLSGMHFVHSDGAVTSWTALRRTFLSACAALTYDDGFYYLKIAENVARGAGSTFDGVNPTNGYHPLWLLCLVSIFKLTFSPDLALVLTVVLQVVLMSIGAGLTYWIVRFDMRSFSAILAVLPWIHAQLPYRAPLLGVEYSLNVVSILVVIYTWRRWFVGEPPRIHMHLVLGLLLGLSFLARLENLLLFGSIGSTLACRELRRRASAQGLGRLLALGVPVVAIVVTYGAANVHLFGHALPISGVIKRDWSRHLLTQDPVYRHHGWWVAKLSNLVWWPVGHMKHAYVLFLDLGSFGAAAWALGHSARTRGIVRVSSHGNRSAFADSATPRDRLSPLPGPVVVFSALQLCLVCVVYHSGYSFERWYYVIQPWLGAVLLAVAAEKIWSRGRPLWRPGLELPLGITMLASVVLASVRTIRQWHNETAVGFARAPIYAAASWVRANVPPTATVAAWNSGTIAYLSGRRVVNLDGLVNSWSFYNAKRKDMCGYWREEGVRYLVDEFDLDRELASASAVFGIDLSPCANRLYRVWIGPQSLSNPVAHAEAFELR